MYPEFFYSLSDGWHCISYQDGLRNFSYLKFGEFDWLENFSWFISVPNRTLKPKEQMFWGLSMVRGVCGIVTLWGEWIFSLKIRVWSTRCELFLAAYLTYVDPLLSIDHVFATTNASWTFTTLIVGFFVFEELTLIYFDIRYKTFSKELHFHHIVSFNGWFIAAWSGLGHYYAVHMFLLEGSTPFSCICWCLLKLKLENTKAWKINQWILIYVFHARTFYELSCWYIYYQDWDRMKANLPWVFIANMFFGLFVLTFWLTPYWTYKKTAQFFFPVDWNAENKKKKMEMDTIDKSS